MSDLRVALVAEGPTDAIVIGAALKALLPRAFVLTRLQPEPTRPELGAGWGGVVRWCLDFAKRGHARLEDDPTLPGFDLLVIHIDADVVAKRHCDVSSELAELATQRGWPALPDDAACPPPSRGADAMRARLLAWAGIDQVGPRTVSCVPSRAIEAWLVAAKFPDGHALLGDLECNLALERKLKQLPVNERIKKTEREYLAHERTVTSRWTVVRERCTQAERFSQDVASVRL
jgi:hypothetical protein